VPAVFITGSGTGVGKTFVASGLIAHYRSAGKPVDALKPIISGFDPAAPLTSDTAQLIAALGRSVTVDEIQRVSPWHFRAPLSPDMAARAEGRTIDFASVTAFCRAAIVKASGTLLIEGIGGIMVPLGPRHTVLDLMVELKSPLFLVGGSYLGTLSHVLSAQDVLLRRGLDLRAIVISESEGEPPPLGETLTTLSNFVAAPLIRLARQSAEGDNSEALQRLAALFG
jgi:dethiobiotin synthetase